MDGVEKCVRCGEDDQDRRTLHMACFYQMKELKIPFEEKKIAEYPGTLFTLRVCKACRGSWLSMLEQWYAQGSSPAGVDVDIPIQVNGATVMLTRAEYFAKMNG